MIKKINLLDKGHVEYIDHMGSDLTVVNAARVSFNKESSWDYADSHVPTQKLSEKDSKLISYLAKNHHWTPFAHPQITLRIKAPIFVRAQLGKHQVGFVMNEVSRRYVTDAPEIYIPTWRSAPTDGAKQGSSGFMEPNVYVTDMYENLADDSIEVYEQLLRQGVAPEQARSALLQGMYTEWWWTGSLAAYARVYSQRIDAHAQWEVQEFAKAINEIIGPLFPVSWKALSSTTK
jgi:thymidylate synthase (FAD)